MEAYFVPRLESPFPWGSRGTEKWGLLWVERRPPKNSHASALSHDRSWVLGWGRRRTGLQWDPNSRWGVLVERGQVDTHRDHAR
jgi:hypothetical protein